MPRGIIEAAKKEELVFFCGAGISTENKTVLPFTFYESICNEIDCKDSLSFSEVMSEYCLQPDGRRKLLNQIKLRFEDIDAFPEIQRFATRFHNELSSIPLINTIITTNWDDYFEKYCDATPITTQSDFTFWDCCDRRVLKIHGSINNISTIIATKEDYKRSAKQLQKGIIGSTLKSILATKTVVFTGFSFTDEDFFADTKFRKERNERFNATFLYSYFRMIQWNVHMITPLLLSLMGLFLLKNLKKYYLMKVVYHISILINLYLRNWNK